MKNLLKTLAIGLVVVFTIGCDKDKDSIVENEFRIHFKTRQILEDLYINKGHSSEMYFRYVSPPHGITNGKRGEHTFPFKFHSIEFKELKGMPLETNEDGLWYDLFMYIDGKEIDKPDFKVVLETSEYIRYRFTAEDLVK